MNPIKFAKRRPVTFLMLVVALVGGGVYGMYRMRVNIPGVNTPKVYASFDAFGVKMKPYKERVVAQYESYFHKHHAEEAHVEAHKILVTSPLAKDVTVTQDYVCLIHSQRHIDVKALDSGYLETVSVKEGQMVKKGDLMFQIKPVLYETKMDAEVAERDLAKLEYEYTKKLSEQKVVSQNEVQLLKAKLAKAQANVAKAKAEFDFTTVSAAFDGMVDRLHEREGSLIKEGEILTTLSDNKVMWVYFNVPERKYLEFMAEVGQNKESPDIELRLANFNKFPELGKIGAIESNFNPETGNIQFRADFENPKGLLRHGQTGTVIISRGLKDAIVIPQRATFETLAKRYVYLVDEHEEVHQREIEIEYTLDDVFVIQKGLAVSDKIVLEGIRQVREGEKVEYQFRDPAKVMADQKHHAE